MLSLEALKKEAVSWFFHLQDSITATLESIERDFGQGDSFQKRSWRRPYSVFVPPFTQGYSTSSYSSYEAPEPDLREGGGGTSALLQGKIFEKGGVNVSEVFGEFPAEFAKTIPGADKDPRFWASGISIVIHPNSPHVPAIHMNTRLVVTTQGWFGGGTDLTPCFPQDEDTQDFHLAHKEVCDRYDPQAYDRFKKWADDYFFLPHRNEARGVGGIFFDHLNSGDLQKDWAFVQDVGKLFPQIYDKLVRRRCQQPWTDEDKARQRQKRGRYVEFNLLYDKGTVFGLKTGGNTESILMSLPPEVTW